MMFCCSSVGLFIIPNPREMFNAVEDEQQFEDFLTVLTACSEHKNVAVFAKEAPLNETVEVPFELYEDTLRITL